MERTLEFLDAVRLLRSYLRGECGASSFEQMLYQAEDISEVDGLLNFYLETSFDVDAVFGTQVCTAENGDWLNVYANYDMNSGQVCDELEIALHRGDGSETALSYHLNAAAKEVLLRKMEDYCQEQTGMGLAEYSAQIMAEAPEPPTGPAM